MSSKLPPPNSLVFAPGYRATAVMDEKSAANQFGFVTAMSRLNLMMSSLEETETAFEVGTWMPFNWMFGGRTYCRREESRQREKKVER